MTLSSPTILEIFSWVIAISIAIGGVLAYRKSLQKSLLSNANALSDSWEKMYRQAEEQNKILQAEIETLKKENHEKDNKISNLEGKVATIMEFLTKAMGPTIAIQLEKSENV